MTQKTIQASLIFLLAAYPLYGESSAPSPAAPVPSYDQPQSRMATEPVSRESNPYLAPANRNPYFDDPTSHVEGVPTGNPEVPPGGTSPNTKPVSSPANDPDSGAAGISGGIGHNGTDGIRGSGD